jgi:hypothetical protein
LGSSGSPFSNQKIEIMAHIDPQQSIQRITVFRAPAKGKKAPAPIEFVRSIGNTVYLLRQGGSGIVAPGDD